MRIVFVLALVVLAGCALAPPTGNVVAPLPGPDGGSDIVSVQVLAHDGDVYPVRIRVSGDAVWPTITVNGVEHVLAGSALADGWLSDSGAVTVYVPSGTYVVEGYACEDSRLGWRCGCVNGDCGNTIRREFTTR